MDVENVVLLRLRFVQYARALGYSEEQFVKLALQDELRRAGLRYRVEMTQQGQP